MAKKTNQIQEIEALYKELQDMKTLFDHKSKALESMIVRYVESKVKKG